jgi:hypothetical protein
MQAGNVSNINSKRNKRAGSRHHTTHPVPGTASA